MLQASCSLAFSSASLPVHVSMNLCAGVSYLLTASSIKDIALNAPLLAFLADDFSEIGYVFIV